MKDNNLEILTPQGTEDGDKPQKMRLNKRTSCIRCGKCCSEGSPALMKEDMRLFISGVLSYDNTYTIREGEMVMSKGDGQAYESFIELVKIKDKEGTPACIFYKGDGECSIYENRPAQCRAYQCWTNDSLNENMIEGLEKNRLTRRDLFSSVDVLLGVIDKHEEKCSYKKLSGVFERLAEGDEDTVEEIMDMLQYDTYARPFLQKKFNVPENALDLVLGRPFMNTVNEFGFKVVKEGDDYILLPIEPEIKGEEEK